MLDRLHRAVVVHVEGEEVAAHAAAQRQPAKRTQIGVGVQAEVAEPEVEVRVGVIGMAGRRFDALLHARAEVAAREVAELELLRLVQHDAGQPRVAAQPDGLLHDVQVDEIAALAVRLLQRLLNVEQEAGEVLAQPQRPHDAEEHVLGGDVPGLVRQLRRDRVALRVLALQRIVGAVEADAAGAGSRRRGGRRRCGSSRCTPAPNTR